MAILSSIHQPNRHLLQMFDKLYILAKGGHCLYFGIPGHLKNYLNECQINCNQNENPVEILLKVSSINSRDKRMNQLIDKNLEISRLTNQQNLRGNTSFMTTNSKSFRIKDIYYLLMRRFQINFIIQWKTLLIETVFHLIFVVILTQAIDENHWKFDGCFQTSTNNLSHNNDIYYNQGESCLEKETRKIVIEQNIYLLYITSFIFMLTTISITTKNLISEMQSFTVELTNRK